MRRIFLRGGSTGYAIALALAMAAIATRAVADLPAATTDPRVVLEASERLDTGNRVVARVRMTITDGGGCQQEIKSIQIFDPNDGFDAQTIDLMVEEILSSFATTSQEKNLSSQLKSMNTDTRAVSVLRKFLGFAFSDISYIVKLDKATVEGMDDL